VPGLVAFYDIWPGNGARDGLKAVLSRQRRGKAAMSLTEARQGRSRGRELEAEARQTKFKARPRRGDPLKKTLLPLDV